MRLTPRAFEVQKVVDLLEDETFDSPEQLAKAVIKEVASLIQMRDTYVLTHTWDSGHKGLNYGPLGSVAEAEALAKKLAIGGTGRIIPITSSGVLLANHEGVKDGFPGYCYDPSCGHAPFTHAIDGASRGACRLAECKCERWIKDDPAIRKKKAATRRGAAKGINEL